MNKFLTYGLTGITLVSSLLAVVPAMAADTNTNWPVIPKDGRVTMTDKMTNGHNKQLEDMASLFGINTDQLKTEMKTKTFEQLITDHGFTKDSFEAKMKERMRADLKAKGMSDDQIDAMKKKIRDHRNSHAHKGTHHHIRKGWMNKTATK